MDSFLIHPLILAGTAVAAMHAHFRQRRYEDVFVRAMFFWLYFGLYFVPNVNGSVLQFFNRYFLFVLFAVEVIGYSVRAWKQKNPGGGYG